MGARKKEKEGEYVGKKEKSLFQKRGGGGVSRKSKATKEEERENRRDVWSHSHNRTGGGGEEAELFPLKRGARVGGGDGYKWRGPRVFEGRLGKFQKKKNKHHIELLPAGKRRLYINYEGKGRWSELKTMGGGGGVHHKVGLP